MNDTMTVESKAEFVAGLEVVINDAPGDIVDAPRFPTLRVECPGYNLLGVCAAKEEQTGKWMAKWDGPAGVGKTRKLTEDERKEYSESCGGGCQGRGWVVSQDLETWLDVGMELGINISLNAMIMDFTYVQPVGGNTGFSYSQPRARDLRPSLISAIYEAVKE